MSGQARSVELAPGARRLAAMSLPPAARTARRGALAIALGMAVMACASTGGGGSGAAASPSASALPSTAPGASTGPSGPVATSPAVPVPGGSGVNPGGPVVNPSPSFVSPVPGLANVHDVHASGVTARAEGSHIIATVTWWSGPPPCTALSEVAVTRSGSAFTLTVREGAQQLGVACPALAMAKATTVDLGPVAPGAYTVGATGVTTTARVVVNG